MIDIVHGIKQNSKIRTQEKLTKDKIPGGKFKDDVLSLNFI
jgi:hypothetical protein